MRQEIQLKNMKTLVSICFVYFLVCFLQGDKELGNKLCCETYILSTRLMNNDMKKGGDNVSQIWLI